MGGTDGLLGFTVGVSVVGLNVGASVGERDDGSTVGFTVGLSVVGLNVGASVGELGLNVGATVGERDDGSKEGLPVGDSVGVHVGFEVVGALLGADEGIANRVLDRAILSIVSQLQFTIFSHLA